MKVTGIDLIAFQRMKQKVEKGFDSEHDSQHINGTLAVVAASLAVNGTDAVVADTHGDRGTPGVMIDGITQDGDCWGLIYHTKDDRIKQLAVAGALLAAEIDRILKQREIDQQENQQEDYK